MNIFVYILLLTFIVGCLVSLSNFIHLYVISSILKLKTALRYQLMKNRRLRSNLRRNVTQEPAVAASIPQRSEINDHDYIIFTIERNFQAMEKDKPPTYEDALNLPREPPTLNSLPSSIQTSSAVTSG